MAANHLVREKEIDGIVLADLIHERAKVLETKLRSRKARAVPVPGTTAADLAKLVEGSDLAINAAHASLDLELMEACLDAGAHYMDLSSVPSKQFPYDAKFRKADLTALLGGGEDPGLGNVLARAAVDRLDTVESIRIRDGDTATSDATPPAGRLVPRNVPRRGLRSGSVLRGRGDRAGPAMERPGNLPVPGARRAAAGVPDGP